VSRTHHLGWLLWLAVTHKIAVVYTRVALEVVRNGLVTNVFKAYVGLCQSGYIRFELSQVAAKDA
jgi:hypothetical protein